MVELWLILLAMGGGIVVGLGSAFIVAMVTDRSKEYWHRGYDSGFGAGYHQGKYEAGLAMADGLSVRDAHRFHKGYQQAVADHDLCIVDSTPWPPDRCVAKPGATKE